MHSFQFLLKHGHIDTITQIKIILNIKNIQTHTNHDIHITLLSIQP